MTAACEGCGQPARWSVTLEGFVDDPVLLCRECATRAQAAAHNSGAVIVEMRVLTREEQEGKHYA